MMNESSAERLEHDEPAESNQGLRLVENSNVESDLHDALSKLSEVDREILRLKFQKGFKYDESGKYLGVSAKSIGKTMHSALRKLQHVILEGDLSNYEVTTSSSKFDKNHYKFTAYALGELDKEDREKGKAYLARHPELRPDIEALRVLGKQIIEELKINPLPALKRGFRNPLPRLKDAVKTQWEERPQVVAGAGGFLILMMMFFMYQLGQKSSSHAPVAHSTPAAEEKTSVQPEQQAKVEQTTPVADQAPAAQKPASQTAVAPITQMPQNKVAATSSASATTTPVVQQAAVSKPTTTSVSPATKSSAPVVAAAPVKTEPVASVKPVTTTTAPAASAKTAAPAATQFAFQSNPATSASTSTPVAEKKVEQPVIQSAQPQVATKPEAKALVAAPVPTATARKAAPVEPVKKPAAVDLSKLGLGTSSLGGATSKVNFKGSEEKVAKASSKVAFPAATDAGSGISMPEGEPKVSGGLTAEEVMAVIRANVGEPRGCYEGLLKRTPTAKGKMIVDFAVGAEGKVKKALVSDSTINDGLMRGCVTSKLKSWKFPKASNGEATKVQYTYTFAPS